MHAPRKKTWQEKFARSGYFMGAVLFHLVIFLMVATVVIWKAPEPPHDDTIFHPVPSVKITPPPPSQPSSGAQAVNPQFEPQPEVVPVVTPQRTITSTSSAAFAVDTSKIVDQALSHLTDRAAQGAGTSAGGGGLTGTGTAFGSFTGTDNQLSGYFYDLKQTSEKKPTGMIERDYLKLLAKYVGEGWDDSLLNSYYKSKAPLYTDRFAISTRPSEEAPKAFGLENEVQPGLWVVHYHGKVTAPQPGEYRLAGFGDNVMVVKIKGTTVLDGGWDSLSTKPNLHELLPFIVPSYIGGANKVHNPHLKVGPTFHLDTAETVDMDVLIGDCEGICSFFLLIEKIGNSYDKMPDGTPKLPFFQISTTPAPTFTGQEEHPPFSTTPEPWQGGGH